MVHICIIVGKTVKIYKFIKIHPIYKLLQKLIQQIEWVSEEVLMNETYKLGDI